MANLPERARPILDYWLGDLGDASTLKGHPKVARWFSGGEAVDLEIRELFLEVMSDAAAGRLDDWQTTPTGGLALVVLLDQFPRNVYRGDPRAFATDSHALVVTTRSLTAGHEEALSLIERSFLYMPLMHSEELAVQELSLEKFASLVELCQTVSPVNVDYFRNAHDFAVRHHAIIARFGRYPHRNAILGRQSTPEEIEFLEQPGSSF